MKNEEFAAACYFLTLCLLGLMRFALQFLFILDGGEAFLLLEGAGEIDGVCESYL